jgi:hypothetical protein
MRLNMNRLSAGLLAAWVFVGPAFADSTINNLGAGAAVQGTDIFPAYQGANPATGPTAAQIKTFANAGIPSSVSGSCGITVSPTTGATVASASITARNNTATTDTLVTGDCGTVVTENNASAVAVGIAQAGTTGFASGYYLTVKNKGAGLVTITPTTSTIDGASTLTLAQNASVDIYSDGTNYITLPGRVPTGTASTIAAGTAALGTGAISSAACATVVTATATGVLTTDIVTASFNGDPTAVTGYIPATAGMLAIFAYPTSGNVNFKVCNNTASPITPGAITLNWRVER